MEEEMRVPFFKVEINRSKSKVTYGTEGCTPFPICVHSCANYLGLSVDYTKVMEESGAASSHPGKQSVRNT